MTTELTLTRSDVLDRQVASGAAVELGQRAQVVMRSSVECTHRSMPCPRQRRRLSRRAAARPCCDRDARPTQTDRHNTYHVIIVRGSHDSVVSVEFVFCDHHNSRNAEILRESRHPLKPDKISVIIS